MKKPLAIVSCPIDTYSGYGARSRDFVKALVRCKGSEWNIRVLPQRWGGTKFGYLIEHNEEELAKLLIKEIPQKPKVWIQITVPNEFQPVGEYNIGVTAGMETTLSHATWIQGVNRMNLVLTSSEHSKKSLTESKWDAQTQGGKSTPIEVSKDVRLEVLFEGIDIEKYNGEYNRKADIEIIDSLDSIKESFCFLFVGSWMQGIHRQDRKNVGGLIENFLTTFKTTSQKPALILKSHLATTSIMDREDMMKKINIIRKKVGGNLPNIYLLHGEINDSEINTLYNHPKVKAMVSLTRGEGFGRPLLEFTTTGKPVIASGWSGQVDFLRADLAFLVGGKLDNVHESAVIKDMILPEAKWFTFDDKLAKDHFKYVFKHYKKALLRGKKQRVVTKKYYTLNKMQDKLEEILDRNVPEFPVEATFVPPASVNPIKIDLPKKLKKN